VAEGEAKFFVTLVTPSGTKEEYSVRHLKAPGTDGDFGVLAGHIPFMTVLRAGALSLDIDEGRKTWAISGGYAEVLGDRVAILAETAERADAIDLDRAQASRRRAMERLGNPSPETDIDRARAALARALNRIHTASEFKRT